MEVVDNRMKVLDISMTAVKDAMDKMEDENFTPHAVLIRHDFTKGIAIIDDAAMNSDSAKEQLSYLLKQLAAKEKAIAVVLISDVRYWNIKDLDHKAHGYETMREFADWFVNLPNEERSKVGELKEAVHAMVNLPGENHAIMYEYKRDVPEEGKVVERGKLTIDGVDADEFELDAEDTGQYDGRFANLVSVAETPE